MLFSYTMVCMFVSHSEGFGSAGPLKVAPRAGGRSQRDCRLLPTLRDTSYIFSRCRRGRDHSGRLFPRFFVRVLERQLVRRPG